ncbi:tetrapyrrole biosynthesis, uroporphyrinogen III synthase [Cylindrobasidium torrendii FP15055 ss-10]|uniref:Tetrapyrrole biosynthesis, uroporphyrinogen III synthase n=1 Tax=Cylindrobasidium torrendii FP15055 ss-10 TaxID=1314674 RepID=A0A0D7BAF4_9AGAR|nr:tetrapyrrole biosynthesis, uroporphyrinogen III synthase [Cylindrobasidium torrendii FP15055 ss-10]
MPNNVLLLRAPAGSPDKYEAVFSGTYSPTSIAVLETVLENIDTLAAALKTVDLEYSAAILTSARSCEAIGEALITSGTTSEPQLPFYVVGKATAAALRAVLPRANIRGEHSGNAEQLGPFILDDLNPSDHRPLLYLTGDKNRETLPSILQPRLKLKPLRVYHTTGATSFPVDLRKLDTSGQWWIVFFAPSAADFVWPYIREYFKGTALKIAAIGPTTSNFLRDKLHLEVHVTASQPTPEALHSSIVHFDEISV